MKVRIAIMKQIYVDDELLQKRLKIAGSNKRKVYNVIMHQAKCQQILDILVEKTDYEGNNYREAENTFRNS